MAIPLCVIPVPLCLLTEKEVEAKSVHHDAQEGGGRSRQPVHQAAGWGGGGGGGGSRVNLIHQYNSIIETFSVIKF